MVRKDSSTMKLVLSSVTGCKNAEFNKLAVTPNKPNIHPIFLMRRYLSEYQKYRHKIKNCTGE
jgi:hypothetical protein